MSSLSPASSSSSSSSSSSTTAGTLPFLAAAGFSHEEFSSVKPLACSFPFDLGSTLLAPFGATTTAAGFKGALGAAATAAFLAGGASSTWTALVGFFFSPFVCCWDLSSWASAIILLASSIIFWAAFRAFCAFLVSTTSPVLMQQKREMVHESGRISAGKTVRWGYFCFFFGGSGSGSTSSSSNWAPSSSSSPPSPSMLSSSSSSMPSSPASFIRSSSNSDPSSPENSAPSKSSSSPSSSSSLSW